MKKHNAMKFTILSAIFCLGILPFSFAQMAISDTTFNYSNGQLLSAFSGEIPNANADQVRSAWIKTIQKGNKTKVSTTNTLSELNRGVVKSIASDSVYVLAEIYPTLSGTRMAISFLYGGIAINSANDPIKSAAARIWMQDFLNSAYESTVNSELKDEKKAEKALEKELNKNQNAIDKIRKKITDLESDIRLHGTNISGHESNQTIQLEKVNAQKIFISNVPTNNVEARKEAEKSLKLLEKEVNKTHKAINKENQKIQKAENKIRDYENDIAKLDGDRKVIQQNLDNQRTKLNEIKNKLK